MRASFKSLIEPSEIGASDAALLQSYLSSVTGEPQSKDFSLLEDELDAFAAIYSEPSLLKALAHKALFRRYFEQQRSRNAVVHGVASIREYSGLGADYRDERIEMHLATGIAFTKLHPARSDAMVKAFEQFDQVVDLSPAQKDLASFSEELAAAISWRQTLLGWAQQSPDNGARYLLRHIRDQKREARQLWRWIDPPPDDCSIEWLEREAPKFPRTEEVKYRVGATIVGYNIDANGSVVDATVFTPAADQAAFQKNALVAAKTWKADPEAEQRADCLRNHIAFVRYEFRE